MRFIVLGLLFSGCATVYQADLEAYDYEKKVGVISYLNEGFSSVIEGRRANAERMMEKQCAGPYQITKMMNDAQYVGAYANVSPNVYNAGASGFAMSMHRNMTYLAFKCQ